MILSSFSVHRVQNGLVLRPDTFARESVAISESYVFTTMQDLCNWLLAEELKERATPQ